MKCIKVFLLILFTAAASYGINNKNFGGDSELTTAELKYKKYGIKSGIIEYESTGTITGKIIVYFDNWGNNEAKFENSEMKMMGITVKENKLTITEGEWVYNINLDNNTGTKTKVPLVEQIIENSGSNDLTDFGEQLMKNMGGKKIGKETVLGKECDIWEIKNLGSKTWVWNWVPLKTDVNLMGQKITQTAVKFDADASVPSDKLSVPSNVQISDGVDLNSIMKKMKSGGK